MAVMFVWTKCYCSANTDRVQIVRTVGTGKMQQLWILRVKWIME